MPILELTKFSSLKDTAKPLLCIDHGDKVIGIATSDSAWSISLPLKGIANKKFTNVAQQIFDIIDERKIIGVVIGLPLNMDGSENERCQSARQFGRNLTKLRDINVCFFDERFSTTMAEQSLSHSDASWDKKQDRIDMIAAGHILEGFMDKISKL